MPDKVFRFRTAWRIAAPLPIVWDTIVKSIQYPTWWPGVARVEVLAGQPWPMTVGTKMGYEVQSPLYTLHYQTELMEYAEHKFIFAHATGDLVGTGKWTFGHEASITEAVFEWQVSLTPPFLRAVAVVPGVPLIMSFFHTRLMNHGEQGLRTLLGPF